MHHGFYTVSAVTPHITLADCKKNALSCAASALKAAKQGARLVVLSELCLTGYTLGDLFNQKALLASALDALFTLADETKEADAVVIAGLPIAHNGALYNCAAVILNGKVIAIVPKTYIPNYSEFYEMRHFSSGATLKGNETIRLCKANGKAGYDVPFGSVIIQDNVHKDLSIAVEICEDLWPPLPPSAMLSLNGATVIANLSCSNEVVGKAEYRRLLVQGQSSRCICAYVYADAGRGESTTDMVFAAHNIIAQNGTVLCETQPFEGGIAIADIDIERLAQERLKMTTFAQCKAINLDDTPASISPAPCRPRIITADLSMEDTIAATLSSHPSLKPSPYPLLQSRPFVPSAEGKRGERCRSVITMQAEGLLQRLSAIYLSSAQKKEPKVVVGLSGGLDSTLALLVACKAFDLLGLEHTGITAVTMPCFGTSSRTLKNATELSREVGATLRTIDITQSTKSHLNDVGISSLDRTAAFENAQARERTQVLMDIANAQGGIVIGTGDLSELALGWCTYNGDQMSMYGVNSSIPKTLVRHLVSYFADENERKGKSKLAAVLRDILDTPVSPELLPPIDGKVQSTEEAVGPYELHDFFLYYTVRFGFAPSKVLFLAEEAGLPYKRDVILKWMRVFYQRFFSQQFKRSAMPDGAKVGTVSLSPRGDWRMPSDASARQWLEEVDALSAAPCSPITAQ